MNNNIGLLRFMAAVAVLFGHSFNLSIGRHGALDPMSRILHDYIPFGHGVAGLGVMVFFVLSGYLVTKSYVVRRDLLTYIESRVLRIFPGLIVAVLFCVLFIGPLTTDLPLISYLKNRETLNFLLYNSSLLDIHFSLPGVFQELPWPRSVNGSLYTLPIEFRMYIYVAVIGVLSILHSKKTFNLLFIFVIISFLSSPKSFPLMDKVNHAYLGLCFLFGAFWYINSKKLHLNLAVALLLIPLLIVVYDTKYYNFFSTMFLSYFVLSLGFSEKIRLPVVDKYGDLSYGVYLYAFPLQQLFIYYFGGDSPWLVVAFSFFVSVGMAFLSWHLIEKKCLSLKGRCFSHLKKKRLTNLGA